MRGKPRSQSANSGLLNQQQEPKPAQPERVSQKPWTYTEAGVPLSHYVPAPLRPGRELDALIAEKVFGFVGVGYYAPTISKGGHLDYERVESQEAAFARYEELWPEESRPEESLYHWKEGWGPLFVPEYSTEIGFAWEIVERMSSGGWFVLSTIREGKTGYFANRLQPTSPVHSDAIDHEAEGESMPHAICLAALRAVDA